MIAVVALTTGVASAGSSDVVKPRPDSAKLFVMAAQDAGGLGESGPVLRYDVTASSAPTLDRTIDDPSFFRPCCFAFTGSGEMFVVNRGDPFVLSSGYISGFVFDSAGNATPHGVISGGGLANPQDLVFSKSGELFVANANANSISRFRFDAAGNATPNGQITGAALHGPAGIDFSPWGELFVGNAFSPGGVSRWTFDSGGTARFNGSFTTPSNVVIDVQFGPA